MPIARETRIGITGHSDLTPASAPVVSSVLRATLGGYPDRGPVGVSCLAQGADQLFAELVLERHGRLEVILPASDYRARKVEPHNADTFDRLLGAAATVRVMGFERSGRHAYMAASAAMLSTIDVLIAVWDGAPSARLGGTGDVVVAARRLGLPIEIVWPEGAARAVRRATPVGAARRAVQA